VTNTRMVPLTEQLAELTAQEWLDLDYATCRDDFFYWLENHGVIVEEDTGKIHVGIGLWAGVGDWPGQREYLQAIIDGSNVISGKARQCGWSWLLENYEYWVLEFKKNRRLALIHRADDEAIEHLERVKKIHRHQPEWIARLPVVHGMDNKHTYALGTKASYSVMRAYPCSEAAARGVSAHLIHCEEFAFWDNADVTYTALRATAGDAHRQVVILSTANGHGNKYHELWLKAELGQVSFKAIFMPWGTHPARDQAWYDQMESDMGPRMMQQEFPATPQQMFAKVEGAIYPQFSRSRHVGRPAYNPDVPLTLGFDWGFNNPCCVLFAQFVGSDRCQVLNELYQSGLAPSQLADEVVLMLEQYGILVGSTKRDWIEEQIQAVKANGNGNGDGKYQQAGFAVMEHRATNGVWEPPNTHRINVGYADPSGAGEIAELELRGIPMTASTSKGGKLNAVSEGIGTVRGLLIRQDMPGLLIHADNCPNLIRELPDYAYNPRAQGEVPIKLNDHSSDALRYLVHGEIGEPEVDWRGMPVCKNGAPAEM